MFIDGLQLPFNVCLTVTCRPIGSGASIINCIYVISVAIAYVTLIKNILTYLLTYYTTEPETNNLILAIDCFRVLTHQKTLHRFFMLFFEV